MTGAQASHLWPWHTPLVVCNARMKAMVNSRTAHTLLVSLLVLLAGQPADSVRSLSQLPSAAWSGCSESMLLLPIMPGESIRNGGGGPSTETNSASGTCVKLTGSVTLVTPNTIVFREAVGTVVFWASSIPATSPACDPGDLTQVASEAAKFFQRNGLIVAGATWTNATCCGPSGTCSGTDVRIWAGPLTSRATPATDWAQVTGSQAITTMPLNPSLYKPGMDLTTAQGCQTGCASTPGCASYLFTPGNYACTMMLNEPSAANALMPCTTTDCVYGFRMPGTCGLTASTGISRVGSFLPGWTPTSGNRPVSSTNPSLPPTAAGCAWAQDGIPAASQGQVAVSISECNCRCISVGVCTGYTYLAASSTCWLQSYVKAWVDVDVDSSGTTVLGRVNKGLGTTIPACQGIIASIGNVTAAVQGSQRISLHPTFPISRTASACYDDCTRDPACQAIRTDSNGTLCWLLSEVSGGTISNNATGTSQLTQLQRCEPSAATVGVRVAQFASAEWRVGDSPDMLPSNMLLALLPADGNNNAESVPIESNAQNCFQLCHDSPGCGAVIQNPATGTCYTSFMIASKSTYPAVSPSKLFNDLDCNKTNSKCMVTARASGYCSFTASSGVLQLGQRWTGWAPGVDFGTWGSAADIEVVLQNATVLSVSDCACRCQASSACIGYIVLGSLQQCWLQSRIDFSVGYQADTSFATVTGRLAVPAGQKPDCSKTSLLTRPDLVPYTYKDNRIFHTPNPFPISSSKDCNEECLLEPFCLAFAVLNASTESQYCRLFSAVIPSGQTLQPGAVFGTVQRCPLVNTGAAAGAGSGGTSSSVIYIAIGAAVGGAVLLGLVAALVICRRRRARLAAGGEDHLGAGPKIFPTTTDYGPASPDPASKSNGKIEPEPTGTHIGFIPHRSAGGTAAWPMLITHHMPVQSSEPSSKLAEQVSEQPTLANTRQALSSKVRATQQLNQQQNPQLAAKELATLTGLTQGDPFLTTAAPNYKWNTDPVDGMVGVEEGVNAGQLDQSASSTPALERVPGSEEGPAPVELSAAEVQQQIELMTSGMIGRGATAVVFKCRWASRFGPNALLAIKCMRDPYAFDAASMLESFQYEAYVLSKCKHENIIRMYGYCLESPVVCIIMELLPCSLKDRLYGHGRHPGSHPGSHAVSRNGNTLGGFSAYQAASPFLKVNPANAGSRQASSMGGALEGRPPLPPKPQPPQPPPDQGSNGTLARNVSTAGLLSADSGKMSSNADSGGLSSTGTQTHKRNQSNSHLVVLEPPTPMSAAEVLQLGVDVASALAHLHSKPEVRGGTNLTAQPTLDVPGDLAPIAQEPDDEGEEDEEEQAPQQAPSKLARVVHRDLKPANILINSLGRAKLTDFGLAREHQNTALHTQHYGAGTLTYMAPELLMGGTSTSLTDKVDIYSLGIMLWELAMMQLPWRGCTDIQIATMVQAGQRPNLPGGGQPSSQASSLGSTASQSGAVDTSLLQQLSGYATLVRACWQQKPHRRPAAVAVRKALQNMVITQPAVEAPADSSSTGATT